MTVTEWVIRTFLENLMEHRHTSIDAHLSFLFLNLNSNYVLFCSIVFYCLLF